MESVRDLVIFLATTLKQGISVAQDNIPAYVEQVLRYGQVRSMVGLLVSIIFFIVSVCALIWVKIGYDKENAEYSEEQFHSLDILDCPVYSGVLITSMLVMFICVISIGINISILIKINTAPIVYLIQQTRYLV